MATLQARIWTSLHKKVSRCRLKHASCQGVLGSNGYRWRIPGRLWDYPNPSRAWGMYPVRCGERGGPWPRPPTSRAPASNGLSKRDARAWGSPHGGIHEYPGDGAESQAFREGVHRPYAQLKRSVNHARVSSREPELEWRDSGELIAGHSRVHTGVQSGLVVKPANGCWSWTRRVAR